MSLKDALDLVGQYIGPATPGALLLIALAYQAIQKALELADSLQLRLFERARISAIKERLEALKMLHDVAPLKAAQGKTGPGSPTEAEFESLRLILATPPSRPSAWGSTLLKRTGSVLSAQPTFARIAGILMFVALEVVSLAILVNFIILDVLGFFIHLFRKLYFKLEDDQAALVGNYYRYGHFSFAELTMTCIILIIFITLSEFALTCCFMDRGEKYRSLAYPLTIIAGLVLALSRVIVLSRH
jgi:hypothetical protein